MKGTLPWVMPRSWFLKRAPYRRFMIRELTSVVLAGYLIFFIFFLRKLGLGGEPAVCADIWWDQGAPHYLVLHGLALLAALYHSISWFNLTPKALPLRIGEERLPGWLVALLGGYLPWVAISGGILWWVGYLR